MRLLKNNSNAVRDKREILIRIAREFLKDDLVRNIDRIPINMRPKISVSSRCCIYKDREIIKQHCMAAMGFGIEENQDELISLREYAQTALSENLDDSKILTILDVACSACIKTSYKITDACRGCAAQACSVICPKNAINFENNKAEIDPEKCVNCGKCMSVCPFHAVVKIPIPCEEACPVGAIKKEADGKEKIDHSKCIYCGKCVSACPFNAIAPRSQFLKTLKALKTDEHLTAIVAPSALGQFPGSWPQLANALIKLGFKEVKEVAEGAMETIEEEASELKDIIEEGQPFMTSSCCPAWTVAVKKHIPELEDFVSQTPSPMYFTAKKAKEKTPGTTVVFIGPCLAKCKEAMNDPNTDFTITFEELGAILAAANIDTLTVSEEGYKLESKANEFARGFAAAGGVTDAIENQAGDDIDIKSFQIDGIDKKSLRELKLFKKNNKAPGNFIEVMSCQGGCVSGPGVIQELPKSKILLKKFC